MLSKPWDAIVLGLGGVGSAAVYQLSRQGHRVLGIDPNPPGHERGSSHGQTRIIRQAYFEHPDYVPLLQDAYVLWNQLEAEAAVKLFHVTGLLQVGPIDGLVVPGVMRSAELHSLPIERLSSADLRSRFPQFKSADDWTAVLEHNAGYLRVEACVLAHLQLASRHGATLRHGDRVIHWRVDGDGVAVETMQGTERASRLVIAAGPWLVQCSQTAVFSLKFCENRCIGTRRPAVDSTNRTPCHAFSLRPKTVTSTVFLPAIIAV